MFSTRTLASLLPLLFGACCAQGQLAINWSTIDGGGGTSSGGTFSLSGTIGQPDAGAAISGGTFTVLGGFWPEATPPAPHCGSADFNHDGDYATDADIEDFFRCIAGNCCPMCDSADFNGDGDYATDADIEAFFRVLAGGPC
jgi:hypothetical protein